MDRYYLTEEREGLTEEREVTKQEFVRAERAAGFFNTLGQPEEPATHSFSGRTASGEVSGRTAYCSPECRAADKLTALTEELGLYEAGPDCG